MSNTPLAERMRPRSLDEYVGQQHLVGPDGIIRKMLDNGVISPLILWGPPGVGKTTLARLVATLLDRPFFTLSAVHAGVKEVRQVLDEADSPKYRGELEPPVLFIDEIHRFSKSQQDSLLGAVEKGSVALIGATTENPSFEVISPLLSRCQVYTLKPLNSDDLMRLVQRACQEDEELKEYTFEFQETEMMLAFAAGDGRRLLNILELIQHSATSPHVVVTNDLIKQLLQRNAPRYDKGGEQHYDSISAFIKSVRGSDPNAAIYWLARMIAGGEDPVFIARRLVILASEDIGLANPNAMLIANAALEAVRAIGMPEGRIPLAEATIYLANSRKSNSAYKAINAALALVSKDTNRDVPLHLRNASTKLMRQMGYGRNYQYPHDAAGNFTPQEYMPEGLENHVFYHPCENARENEGRKYLNAIWQGKYGY